jgi:hypothetical protein
MSALDTNPRELYYSRYMILLPRVTQPNNYRTLTDTPGWDDWVRLLQSSTETPRKHDIPLFGPYVLRHGAPARHNEYVAFVHTAVFDVDKCPAQAPGALERCRAALEGVGHIWYTTFSHTPDAPSLRLVIPLAHGVSPDRWAGVRHTLAARYRVPCNLQESSGASHCYYLPSHPPGATPYFEAHLGPPAPVPTEALPPPAPVPQVTGPLYPQEDPQGRTLDDLLLTLEGAADRHDSYGREDRASYLRALVSGLPLGDSARDPKTASACAMLVHNLHPLPRDTYVTLLQKSVDSMIAAGSSLRWPKVLKMLDSAARKWHERRLQDEEFRTRLERSSQERTYHVVSPNRVSL